MDVLFKDDNQVQVITDNGIEIIATLAITGGVVRVEAMLFPHHFVEFSVSVSGWDMWEIEAADNPFEQVLREDKPRLRSALTALLVVIDQWATPERFAAAKVKDAEERVAEAQRAAADAVATAEKAKADLLAAQEAVQKRRP